MDRMMKLLEQAWRRLWSRMANQFQKDVTGKI